MRKGGFTHDPCVDCRCIAGAHRSRARDRSTRKIARDDSRARNRPARRTTLRRPGLSRPRSLSTDKISGGRVAGNARIHGPHHHPPVPQPIRRHGAIERQRSRHIIRQLLQAPGPRSPARHQALKAPRQHVLLKASVIVSEGHCCGSRVRRLATCETPPRIAPGRRVVQARGVSAYAGPAPLSDQLPRMIEAITPVAMAASRISPVLLSRT